MRTENIYYPCAKCDKSNKATKVVSFDPNVNPELKRAIIDSNFFEVTCAHCGEVNTLEYSFYYDDSENGLCVYLYINSDKFSKREPFADMKLVEGVHYRIVESFNALREKILIHDAHLNDKIIEVAKYRLTYQYNMSSIATRVLNIYFQRAADDMLVFWMLLDNNTQVEAMVPMSALGEIMFDNVYGFNFAEVKDDYLIDPQWVMEHIAATNIARGVAKNED